MAEIYTVEVDLADRDRLGEWNHWYQAHTAKLMGVPGFLSAQRFVAAEPGPSPFLAIYGIESAAVLDSPEYRAVGGPESVGAWKPLMINWFRNILEGPERPSPVPQDGWILLGDRLAAESPTLPSGFMRFCPVGLDRTIVERGMLTGTAGSQVPRVSGGDSLTFRLFRPL